MTLLHAKVAEKAILSVLYSDVGDYYSRIKREHSDPALSSGWQISRPYNVTWSVVSAPEGEHKLSGFHALIESDIRKVCERDSQMLQEEVIASKSQSAFAILPSKDQMDWQIARCKFSDTFRHPKSRNDYPFIDDWGCESGKPGDPNWAFAIWSYDLSASNLIILRLRCNKPKQLQAIVHLAHKAAYKQGMKTITAWNVGEHLLEGTPWQNMERKEHLPAMAWYRDGAPPEWLCNEVSFVQEHC